MGTLNKSEIISYINLTLPDSNFLAKNTNHALIYEELLNPLTLKYGKPTRTEREPQETLTETDGTWIFPTTTISLQLLEGKIGFGLVTLHYEKANKMSGAI